MPLPSPINDMDNIRVSLIGPYPPPYGGVSIHIQRLKERLDSSGIACTVSDFSNVFKKEPNVIVSGNSKWDLIRWLISHLFRRENIIHYHGNNSPIITSILCLTCMKRKKIVLTLHSFRYDAENMRVADKFFFLVARLVPIFFIVVGPEIKNKIMSLGIKSDRIEIIQSFIPPCVREEEIAEVPKEVWRFMNCHTPVISANASKIVFYNNQDLYGLDMCIELCAKLKQYYPRIGLVFALPDIGDYEYLDKMKRRIEEKGIKENFLFQSEPCQLYPILMKSDIFTRPTNTDSYGISVAEAIYYRIPAIASDVCLRPEGTILFENRNTSDFISKVKDVLDNYNIYKGRLNNLKIENNAEKIIEVYKKVMKV